MSNPPKDRYDGVIERTPQVGVIRFERHLGYPVRDVWEAMTDPGPLADWWLPFDAENTVDLREGGEIVMAARRARARPRRSLRGLGLGRLRRARAHYATLGFAPPVGEPDHGEMS